MIIMDYTVSGIPVLSNWQYSQTFAEMPAIVPVLGTLLLELGVLSDFFVYLFMPVGDNFLNYEPTFQ